MNIAGLGPDAPTTENSNGGRQSHVPYRLDLLPPQALFAVAEVLDHGARKYGEENWRAITVREHLNHALAHSYGYLAGDAQEGAAVEHLKHAACRILFALGVELQGGPLTNEAIVALLTTQGRPTGPLDAGSVVVPLQDGIVDLLIGGPGGGQGPTP